MLTNDGPAAQAAGSRCVLRMVCLPALPVSQLTIFCTAWGKKHPPHSDGRHINSAPDAGKNSQSLACEKLNFHMLKQGELNPIT